ncbi:MAG: T9SS type A sorting domain-containing protein [Flavobacterium sp.]|nr:MAG: T9SS type A sorting domain-containing protein [Flavobacterium sp.]
MNKFTYLLMATCFFCLGPMHGQVVINEVVASNTTINTDEDATYQDWVELYNRGASSVNLSGYGLTDDATLPHKWTFPAVTMAPNTYLLVWCSDKNRAVAGQPLHSNFKISSTGETLTLTNVASVTVDAVTVPAIPSNISYGRIANGTGSFMFIQAVTPAAANGNIGYTQVLSPPTFSQNSGFFTSGFNLTLSTTTPGATIYYTTDGSDPDPANLSGTQYDYRNVYAEHPGDSEGPILHKTYQSLAYNAPISIVDRTSQANDISTINATYKHSPTYLPTSFNVFKGTVIRAITVKQGALTSPIASETYIVSPLGANRFTLPVISIGITESKLFDYTNGIYVAGKDWDDWRDANPTLEPDFVERGNYFHSGAQYEETANFTYLVNGVDVVNQTVGLRIHGGESSTYESKSFNVYARADYGSDKMDYKFFSNLNETNFDRLVFRNSGGDFHNTMFRDALNHNIVRNLNSTIEEYQPTITLINGEYWGILNIRERRDGNYFKRVYNIDSADLDLLENDGLAAEYIESGDNTDFLNLQSYFQNNSLVSDANYQYIKTRIDTDNFMDYFIANIYMDNGDWPGTNVVYWRKKVPYTPSAPYGEDGRWRWVFHDMDDTFGVTADSYNHNNLASATATGGPDWPNPDWSTLFLRKLLQNPTFKNEFISRFADLMNTTFIPSRVISLLNELNNNLLPEIVEHQARFKSPATIDDRDFFIDFETNFANQRPAFQRNHIRSKFGIPANINVTLNVSSAAAGYVKINTINIKDGTDGISGNPYPWTGIYFSGIPITLKAVALPGYVFDHWTGASSATTDQITLTSASALSVTAVFAPVAVAQSQPIYFWLMDGNIPNNVPLTSLASTFETNGIDGNIQYQSCLPGYPYTSADALWRKASMERRNNPTPINYIPEANGGAAYAAGDMKGLQITEPLASGSAVNTMIFNFSTVGYKDIKFSFAAVNELTNATGILIDYSTVSGTPVWTTAGLASSTLPLTSAFQLYNIDFTSITAAGQNANFKIRLRFTGSNMDVSNGNRITFNNIAVHGTQQLGLNHQDVVSFIVYPNPTNGILNVGGTNGEVDFRVYAMDGRLVKSGKLNTEAQLFIDELNSGLYLLQLTSDGKTETKKIFKK